MVDNLKLFASNATDFDSNGLGFLSGTTKCVVEEERNGIFELELEYPMTGRRFSDLQLRNIIVAKPNPYDDPQPFRIYQISKPIKGIVTINARHISYDLSDWVCLPFLTFDSKGNGRTVNETYFPSLISRLKSNYHTGTNQYGVIYDPNHNFPFTFETNMQLEFLWEPEVDPETGNPLPDPETGQPPYYRESSDHRFKFFRPASVRSVLGESKESGVLGKFIVNGQRCEFKYDGYRVIFNQHRWDGENRAHEGFEVRYGKNMTDLDHSETADKDYTDIFPFWKSVNSDDTTVAVLGGTDDDPTKPPYVPIVSRGYHKFLVRDLSSDFDSQPNATDMRAYAEQYIKDEELQGAPTTNITVNFVELSKSSEYSKYKNLERVQLCDLVTVIHEGLGIRAVKKVIKTVYDVISEKYTSIDLGDPRDNLASTVSGTMKVTNINTDYTTIINEQGIAEMIKKVTTIYYLKTVNPEVAPDQPSLIVTNRDASAIDMWICVEPDMTHDGILYTMQQRIVSSGMALFDGDPATGKGILSKVVNTVKGFIDDVKDGAGRVIGNTLNGTKITEETVGSSAITTSAVVTSKIDYQAVTHDKISVNALYSNNFVAYADWNSSSTYHSGDIKYYNSKLYECVVATATTGVFVSSQWKELPSNMFSSSGTYFKLDSGIISSKNFAIDANGNAAFRGYVYASSGSIGNIDINDGELDVNGIVHLGRYGISYGPAELSQGAYGNGSYFATAYSTASDTGLQFRVSMTGGLNQLPLASIYLHEASPDALDYDPNYADGGMLDGYWTFGSYTRLIDHPNESLHDWISRVESSAGSQYVLPIANTTSLGGVKVRSSNPIIVVAPSTGTIDLRVNEGVDNDKYLKYIGDGEFVWAGTSFTLTPATSTNLGGVRLGSNDPIVTVDSTTGVISLRADDNTDANKYLQYLGNGSFAWTGTTFTLSVATDTTLGGIRVGTNNPIITVSPGTGVIDLRVDEGTDNGKYLQYNGDGIFSWATIPTAKSNSLGGVIIGSGLTVSANGLLSAPFYPTNTPAGTNYLLTATSSMTVAPKYTTFANVAERTGSSGAQGQSILSLGTTENERTSSGAVGIMRLFRTNTTIMLNAVATSSTSAKTGRYALNPDAASTNNTVLYLTGTTISTATDGTLAAYERGTGLAPASLAFTVTSSGYLNLYNGALNIASVGLPIASSSNMGLISLGYTTSSADKTYALQVDSSGNAFVSVNWADTKYYAGTALALTTSSDGFYYFNVDVESNEGITIGEHGLVLDTTATKAKLGLKALAYKDTATASDISGGTSGYVLMSGGSSAAHWAGLGPLALANLGYSLETVSRAGTQYIEVKLHSQDSGLAIANDDEGIGLRVKYGTYLKVDSAGNLDINTGSTAGTVALGNHTHTTSISPYSSSGSGQILSFGGSYMFGVGGTSAIFTLPSNPIPTLGTGNIGKVLMGDDDGTYGWQYIPTATSSIKGLVMIGSTSSTVSPGNHTHSEYALTVHSHVATDLYLGDYMTNAGSYLTINVDSGVFGSGDHGELTIREELHSKKLDSAISTQIDASNSAGLARLNEFVEANVFKIASVRGLGTGDQYLCGNDGMLWSMGYYGTNNSSGIANYGAQLIIDDTKEDAGGIIFRGKNSSGWSDWKKVLHEKNVSLSVSDGVLYLKCDGNTIANVTLPGTCLMEGTKILMADGSEKNIEDVIEGDNIMSYDPTTKSLCEAVVIDNVGTGRANNFTNYYFDNGSVLTIFGDHLLYSENEGTARSVKFWEPGWESIGSDGDVVAFIGSEEVTGVGHKRHYDLHSSNKLYFANGILNAQGLTIDYACYKNRDLPESYKAALKADYDLSVSVNQHKTNPTVGARIVPILKEMKRQKKILDDNKKLLADTDYIVAKFTEGLIGATEWLKAKAERSGWRKLVNSAEESYATAKAQYDSFMKQFNPSTSRRQRFAECVSRDNECLADLKAYYASKRKIQNEDGGEQK